MTSAMDCVASYIASAFSFCSPVYIIPSFLPVQDFVRRASQANPYSLYTVSLKALSSGTVSALGIVEPLSATLFGTFLFGEKLTLWTAAGIVLILSSVVLLGKAAVNVGQS